MPLKNPKNYQPLFKGLIFCLAGLIVLELILRFGFGFGQIPVYYKSDAYEYALKPDQRLVRFGNFFQINEQGMRSAPLQPGEFRILKFGDSVLHGGLATDQSELSSEILEAQLQTSQENIRVLNVSAGSWGPDNAFAWLSTHGDFDAKAIVLVFSSHDWQDQMNFQDVVGNISFYPNAQPALAITDAFQWVFSRYITSVAWNEIPYLKQTTKAPHNHGWDDFIAYAKQKNLPLLVYHHATLEEVQQMAWSADGLALENFLKDQGVKIVRGLDAGWEAADYRDGIHPNDSGQAKIAEALLPVLQEMISDE